jgi:pentatricopeptide repeat protein
VTAGNMTRASLFPTKDSKFHLQRQMGMGFFSTFSSSRRKGYFVKLDNAIASFNRMLDRNPQPPIIEFNRLISSVVRMRKYETVVSFFKEMEFQTQCLYS